MDSKTFRNKVEFTTKILQNKVVLKYLSNRWYIHSQNDGSPEHQNID